MRKIFCLSCFQLLVWYATAQADYVFKNSTEENGPIPPGGIVGGIYRFPDVKTGLDALVTITAMTGGATLTAIDNPFSGYDEAFCPNVVVPANSNGYVEFKICFVVHSTSIAVTLPSLSATPLDVDGFGGNVFEYDRVNMGPGGSATFMNGSPDLAVTGDINGFLGSNTRAVDFAGISTGTLNLMFTVTNDNVSCFTYQAGVNNLSSTSLARLKGLYFKSFTYPSEFVLATRVQNFSASVIKDQVLLRWEVLEDRPSITYWVKRWDDCRVAASIGSKAGRIQNANINTYQFLDIAPLPGTSCYSIEWNNEEGKRMSSNMIPVTINATNRRQGTITTDPYSNKSSLTWYADNTSRDCDIKFYLPNGQQIKQLHYKEIPGLNKMVLTEPGSLQPGMYVVVFAAKGAPSVAYKLLVRPN